MTGHIGGLDVEKIRKDFPILARTVGDRPLVYLDSAATSQKPQQVIDAESDFYAHHNANAHRGLYMLGEEATELFEGARAKLARFFGAPGPRDDRVHARAPPSRSTSSRRAGDGSSCTRATRCCITEMEHHSNIVPWQMTAAVTGATLRYIPLTDDGQLDLSDLGSLLTERTKILSVTGMSNALGTITPLRQLVDAAHAVGAIVGGGRRAARAAPSRSTCTELDCRSSWRFSGHKMLGPTASGGLYGKAEVLDAMDPMFGGGEMIHEVFHDHSHVQAGPVQVRGRHDADRAAGRAGRGGRLPRGARHGRRPRARGGDHAVRARPAARRRRHGLRAEGRAASAAAR